MIACAYLCGTCCGNPGALGQVIHGSYYSSLLSGRLTRSTAVTHRLIRARPRIKRQTGQRLGDRIEGARRVRASLRWHVPVLCLLSVARLKSHQDHNELALDFSHQWIRFYVWNTFFVLNLSLIMWLSWNYTKSKARVSVLIATMCVCVRVTTSYNLVKITLNPLYFIVQIHNTFSLFNLIPLLYI